MIVQVHEANFTESYSQQNILHSNDFLLTNIYIMNHW